MYLISCEHLHGALVLGEQSQASLCLAERSLRCLLAALEQCLLILALDEVLKLGCCLEGLEILDDLFETELLHVLAEGELAESV